MVKVEQCWVCVAASMTLHLTVSTSPRTGAGTQDCNTRSKSQHRLLRTSCPTAAFYCRYCWKSFTTSALFIMVLKDSLYFGPFLQSQHVTSSFSRRWSDKNPPAIVLPRVLSTTGDGGACKGHIAQSLLYEPVAQPLRILLKKETMTSSAHTMVLKGLCRVSLFGIFAWRWQGWSCKHARGSPFSSTLIWQNHPSSHQLRAWELWMQKRILPNNKEISADEPVSQSAVTAKETTTSSAQSVLSWTWLFTPYLSTEWECAKHVVFLYARRFIDADVHLHHRAESDEIATSHQKSLLIGSESVSLLWILLVARKSHLFKLSVSVYGFDFL